VLQFTLANHLLLSIAILLALFLVPAVLMRDRGLRESHGNEHRKVIRMGLIVERDRIGESQGKICSRRNDTLALSNNLTTTS